MQTDVRSLWFAVKLRCCTRVVVRLNSLRAVEKVYLTASQTEAYAVDDDAHLLLSRSAPYVLCVSADCVIN